MKDIRKQTAFVAIRQESDNYLGGIENLIEDGKLDVKPTIEEATNYISQAVMNLRNLHVDAKNGGIIQLDAKNIKFLGEEEIKRLTGVYLNKYELEFFN